jgi:hypothetical protein
MPSCVPNLGTQWEPNGKLFDPNATQAGRQVARVRAFLANAFVFNLCNLWPSLSTNYRLNKISEFAVAAVVKMNIAGIYITAEICIGISCWKINLAA